MASGSRQLSERLTDKTLESRSTRLTYTLSPVRTGMGDLVRPGSTPGGGTLFRYVTNHPGRLSCLPSVGR